MPFDKPDDVRPIIVITLHSYITLVCLVLSLSLVVCVCLSVAKRRYESSTNDHKIHRQHNVVSIDNHEIKGSIELNHNM